MNPDELLPVPDAQESDFAAFEEAIAECPMCHGPHSLSSCPRWRVVPKEPTDDMINAGRRAFITTRDGEHIEWWRAAYRAMIAMAPHP